MSRDRVNASRCAVDVPGDAADPSADWTRMPRARGDVSTDRGLESTVVFDVRRVQAVERENRGVACAIRRDLLANRVILPREGLRVRADGWEVPLDATSVSKCDDVGRTEGKVRPKARPERRNWGFVETPPSLPPPEGRFYQGKRG